MKYKIYKGILHCDDKPVFALGASYYPSFLPSKYQVPESGDRIGEMKIDLKKMKESGLNFFRTAALAELAVKENGDIAVNADFIDQMVKEAESAGLASSVRLNGYFVNFSNNKDFEFVNNRGESLEKSWNAFMRGSFYHKGFMKDNIAATRALANHFEQFSSVVSYQIYNEPHYPFNGVFDYNHHTQKAYVDKLVADGIITSEQAKNYKIPTERPRTKDEIESWVRWRLFSQRALGIFLDKTAKAALEASSGKDTYTCYTTAVCSDICANLGITYFDDAPNLTTTAITTYTPFDGADYFAAAYTIALAESSAAVYGKKAWTAELDKRTKMPASKFFRETYEVIGAGHKGICYYEWRGDYPDPDSPHADNCGFLHYDGSPTYTFEDNLKLISLINKYSSKIVLAEKIRSGVAILHSDRAMMYYDALSDPEIGGKNMWIHLSLKTFKEIKKIGFAPDFIRSCDLQENKLGVQILFVPTICGLGDEELEQIRQFCNSGNDHKVFYGEQITTFDSITVDGWRDITNPPANRVTDEFSSGAEIEDVFEELEIKPLIETKHKNLFAHILHTENEKIVVLVSNRPKEKSIPKHEIMLNFDAHSVKLVSHNQLNEVELAVDNGKVILPEISDGAILFVK